MTQLSYSQWINVEVHLILYTLLTNSQVVNQKKEMTIHHKYFMNIVLIIFQEIVVSAKNLILQYMDHDNHLEVMLEFELKVDSNLMKLLLVH